MMTIINTMEMRDKIDALFVKMLSRDNCIAYEEKKKTTLVLLKAYEDMFDAYRRQLSENKELTETIKNLRQAMLEQIIDQGNEILKILKKRTDTEYKTTKGDNVDDYKCHLYDRYNTTTTCETVNIICPKTKNKRTCTKEDCQTCKYYY